MYRGNNALISAQAIRGRNMHQARKYIMASTKWHLPARCKRCCSPYHVLRECQIIDPEDPEENAFALNVLKDNASHRASYAIPSSKKYDALIAQGFSDIPYFQEEYLQMYACMYIYISVHESMIACMYSLHMQEAQSMIVHLSNIET